MDSVILRDSTSWGEHDGDDGGRGQGGLQFSGGIAEEALPLSVSSFFRNIPCLACGSNCVVKRETTGDELSWSATLTGTEFLKIFCQILKIRGGSGSKVNGWGEDSDGGEGEGVPICNDCKSQLSVLEELERKLRELGLAFRNGVREFRKLCEGAEGVFEREGIYDKDQRYFRMRKQFVRLPVKSSRPRRTRTEVKRVKTETISYMDADPEDIIPQGRSPRRRSKSIRTKGLSALSSYSPVVAVSAEDRDKADQFLKTENGDTESDIYDNADDGPGSLEHIYLEDEASFSNNNDDSDVWRPSGTNKDNSKSKRPKRKVKSKVSSRSTKSKDGKSKGEILISPAPSPSPARTRRKRKLPQVKVETDEIGFDDSDLEEGPGEKDSDFELDEKDEEEALKKDNLLDDETLDLYKERTRHDPTTGLYSVLHVKFRPLMEASNKLECQECQTICSKRMIRVHAFKCHTSMFRCKVADCGKSFGYRNGLRNHILIDHKKVKKKYRKVVKECSICGKPCLDMSAYQMHITTHYSEQDKAEAIARGEQLHTYKDRPMLQCDHCGSKCLTKALLERHILSKHPKEESESDQLRKFKELCPECGVFLYIKSLARHRLTVHSIGPDGQPQDPEAHKHFICSYCDKRFFTSRELLNHKMAVHEKIYPFKCTLCPRTFSGKPQLNRHMITHSNVRPYPCLHCPTAFYSVHHLRRHVNTYHAEGAKPGRKAYIRGATSSEKQKSRNNAQPTYLDPSNSVQY